MHALSRWRSAADSVRRIALTVTVAAALAACERAPVDEPPTSAPSVAASPRELPTRTPAPRSARATVRVDDPVADARAVPVWNPATPREAKPGRLIVRVHAAADDKPLVGARVHVREVPADHSFMRESRSAARPETVRSTDEAGVARFECDSDGSVLHSAEADGHVASAAESAEVPAGGELTVEVKLAAATSVEGRVLDAETGNGVATARVLARPPGRIEWAPESAESFGAVTTDGDGAFRVTTLPPGIDVELRATADGFATSSARVRAGAAGATVKGIEIRLARRAAAEGIVRSAEGAPVAGAKVYAMAHTLEEVQRLVEGLPWPARGMSDVEVETVSAADGSFRLEGLSIGTSYVVYAWADNPASFAMTTTSAAANAPRIDLTLSRFPRVLLRLLDNDGKPVSPEQVITYVDANGQYGAPVDAEGWADVAAELGGLGPGRRRITVLASGFVPAFLNVETKAGVDTRAELRLQRGVGISGRVTRADGTAFGQAILDAEPECNAAEIGGNQYDLRQLAFSGFTDADGRFQIDGLMPVPYRLRVRGFEGSAAVVVHLTPPAKDLALVVHDASRVTFALKLPVGNARPVTPVFVALRRSKQDAQITDVVELSLDKSESLSCVLPEPGAWVVGVHLPGYLLLERSVDVKPGESADLGVLSLDRGLALEGRVAAPDGSPIASALVRLPDDRIEKRGRWNADHPRLTDADGRFRATGFAPGPVEIWVWAQGYAVHRMRVEMKPEPAPVHVALVPGTIVRGVARFNGVGVSDAEIRVSAPDRPGDPNRTGTLNTDRDGGFVLALPAGHYVVEASHPRIGAGRAEFDVGAESAPRAEVVLERRK